MINLKSALDLTLKTVKSAFDDSKILCSDNNIMGKELRDIVTDVDLFIESRIINALKQEYPDHYYSAEEAGKANIADSTHDYYEWVIDPIDGTINFAAGLPFYTTSVCLKHNNELVMGAIFHHATGDVYWAIKGKGAFINDEKIFVSKNTEAKDCVLSFMLTSHYDQQQTDWILEIVRKLSLNTRGLRLLVSQAFELALIASGKLDGTVCIKSRGFSSSAGALLVQEAGGIVSDLYGNERSQKSTSLLVSNGLIHNELLELIN